MDKQSHIKIEMLPQKFDGYFDKNMAEAQKQRAIAKAAPVLLEALEAMMPTNPIPAGRAGHEAYAKAVAAIAKARGE